MRGAEEPLDGLVTSSTMYGQVAVLFAPADDSNPDTPSFAEPLKGQVVAATIIEPFIDRTGWRVM